MYKVVKIDRCAVTSFIDLLNLKTGTTEHGVFDDSSMVDIGYDDFEFIKEGGIYDCKMELFGEFSDKSVESSTEVTIVESGVIVGETKYFKVMIGSDVYYILESDAKNVELKQKMYYDFTRKDLIQVNDVIHADCL